MGKLRSIKRNQKQEAEKIQESPQEVQPQNAQEQATTNPEVSRNRQIIIETDGTNVFLSKIEALSHLELKSIITVIFNSLK